MHVLVVFGTRPEAIKLAPVVRELLSRASGAGIRTTVCVTGQHRQMLDQVLELFSIKPDIDLDLMQPDQSPAAVASAAVNRLAAVLTESNPDWLLVQGDTTTALAAALAGFYAGVKVGHVEAGLRSGRRREPFPEEINRRLISVLADIHFAPTQRARDCLIAEGIDRQSIAVTGNTVIDALWDVAARPAPAGLEELIWKPQERLGSGRPRLLLVTMHRRESFGSPLEQVCDALRFLSEKYRDGLRIVYPVHMNPNVNLPVRRLLGGTSHISLVEPLDYASFVHLMKRSHVVLTDSGGIQEEAPALGIPVLVMRSVTERTEAIESGAVKLIGTSRDEIVRSVSELLDDAGVHLRAASVTSPYGDGRSSQRIVKRLLGEPCDEFVPGSPRDEGDA